MNNSERVQKQRKATYDRISTLIDKGGKHLLHAQALREGITVAEMLRRAVYARAGLRMLPYPDDLEKLAEVRTQEEAEKAIRQLQAKEESSEIMKQLLQQLAPEPDSAQYQLQVDHDTRRVLLRLAGFTDAEISSLLESRWGSEEQITASGFDIGHLRRLLANIQDVAEKE